MRRIRHALTIGCAALGVTGALLIATPVSADDDDQWANPDGDGGIGYGIDIDPGTYVPDTGSTDYSDDYSPTDLGGVAEELTPAEETEGAVYSGLCTGMFENPAWCDTPEGPGGGSIDVEEAPPPPNPADLGQIVMDSMQLPSPKITMAPRPPNPTLVQLWTWFWIPQDQWQSQSDSISAGGITVTVTIEPEKVVWDTGEGTVTCDGPGEPWSPGSDAETSSCGHRYEHTTVDQPGGTYPVSATIQWHASWTCTGACMSDGGDFGLIDSDSSTAQVEVRQRQSLVIE